MNKHTRKELLEDLVYLRKDAGFVPERLALPTVFLEVVHGGVSGPYDESDYETLKKRLLSAIDTLVSQDAEALKVAYGLLPEYVNMPTLRARREKYGEAIHRKYDTLVARENAAINDLALTLLTARYAASPLPVGTPVLHSAALQERVEILTIVRDRMWLETRELYRLIPLMDNVGFLEISSSIPAIVTPTCDCVLKTKTTSNGLSHRFFYKEPLKRGKPVELSFVMNPDPDKDGTFEYALIDSCRAFHEPTLSFKVEVVFLDIKPEIIWQYRQLPFFTRPGEPTRGQLLDLADTSVIGAEFSDLYGGLFSGIAWRWE